MLTELKAIFENVDKEILSEETLKSISTLIEKKVNDRVTLEVESKLQDMDNDHAAKLKKVLESHEQYKQAIDKDHTAKAKKVVEAINKGYIKKLYVIKEKYENQVKNVAISHRDALVESVNDYLESYIDKAIPAKTIQEAAKNRFHENVLKEAREILGVDSKFIKSNVKQAIKDGKNHIDKLALENAQLKKAALVSESKRILVEKTENLPADTARFVRQKLDGKTPQFIKENFNYVLDMFERKEKNEKNSLLNEGKKPNVDRAGVADEIIKESSKNNTINTSQSENPQIDMYLDGMNFRK